MGYAELTAQPEQLNDFVKVSPMLLYIKVRYNIEYPNAVALYSVALLDECAADCRVYV